MVHLAGVDEVGRGPLAGPVVAAAVHLPSSGLESYLLGCYAGLTDSKKLSPARREHFAGMLANDPEARIGVGCVEVADIDRLNILRATHLAMARALEALGGPVDLVLVDGLPVPGLPFPSEAIVGGDAKSLLIAAASVVAKVTRDRAMVALDARFPGYGFAIHKGYGTAAHLAALQALGPCPEHRRSFAPVRAALEAR